MMRRLTALFAATCMAFPACADPLRDRATALFEPLPDVVSMLKGTPITPEAVALGKALFFDPRLSASGLFSCASCHNLATGGDDNIETSVGHGSQKGPRNAPTVLNAVLNAAQFWDGRAADLAAQAQSPIKAGIEMSNTAESVEITLYSLPPYEEWFVEAFPGQDPALSFDNLAHAIEAFEATLLTPAPWDA
ncbi:MAG: cytochrome-c peroxidase, partial [Paracoccaceae bacterium]